MPYRRFLPILIVVVVVVAAVACTAGTSTPVPVEPQSRSTAAAAPEPTATVEPLKTTVPELVEPTPVVRDTKLLDDKPSGLLTIGWKTDFSKHSVPYGEIQFLGVSRIPIISSDINTHDSIEEGSGRVSELEPVIVVEINGEARAYPQSLLIFVAVEVVNDVLGGVPIAVTW